MKVRELRNKLRSVNGDLEVEITYRGNGKYVNVTTDYECAGIKDGKYYICCYEDIKLKVER